MGRWDTIKISKREREREKTKERKKERKKNRIASPSSFLILSSSNLVKTKQLKKYEKIMKDDTQAWKNLLIIGKVFVQVGSPITRLIAFYLSLVFFFFLRIEI